MEYKQASYVYINAVITLTGSLLRYRLRSLRHEDLNNVTNHKIYGHEKNATLRHPSNPVFL